MALDEYLYGKLSGFFKRKNYAKMYLQEGTVSLKDIKPKLSILASAVSGEIIEIFNAEREGGYKNNAFFLPEYVNFFDKNEENLQFYLFRTLYMCEQKKLGYNYTGTKEVSYEQRAKDAIQSSEEIMKSLVVEFPELEIWHKNFVLKLLTKNNNTPNFNILNWLYGKWMSNDIKSEKDTLLKYLNDKTKAHQKMEASTHLKAKAIEQIKRIEVDKKSQEDYVLTHNFEKVETADDFSGNWRDFDGDDELQKHQNALDELSLGLTVRVDDPVHSIYQSEYLENLNISESANIENNKEFLTYNEWDYKKNTYKQNYCKLYPERIFAKDNLFYENTIQMNHTPLVVLRKTLANINNKLQQKRGQYDGEELDLDAVTDYYTAVHVGSMPSENIYLQKRKLTKDISMLILLDLSLSSDGYVQGKRILDLEKEAAILFGEVLAHENVDFSIAGFYSNTRNHTTYQTIKDFDDNWNIAKYAIGGVEAIGYTRIGTAIRHSTSLLKERKANNKWLVILSDGKPNDYDKYEGKYGVEDVRQALKELYSQNMNAYAYAIEANAKYYLPQMFGANHFQIIAAPTDMVSAFTKLFLKLKQSL